MKKLFGYLLLAVITSGLFSYCHEEEPPPPHPLVGTWLLDVAMFKNTPTGYSNWENYALTVEDIIGDGDPNTNEKLEYVYNNDNTYKRTLYLTGPNDVVEGTWAVDGSLLTLSPDGETFDDEFEILGDIEEFEMTLSLPAKEWLLPDAVTDTLTDYSLSDAVRWEQIWTDYGAEVDINLWFIYDRQQ
ncbi:MAG: hypothetical protein OEX02_12330 [Cyclobacteriaceae bacterium]|nr:hypothetical protein [Cyclobacteriaceae bacterium]